MPRLGQRLPTCRPHPSPCDLACWDFVAFLERKMSRNSKGTKRLALPLSFKKMIGLYLNICFRLLFIEEISVKSGKPNKVETNGSEMRAVEATAGCPRLWPLPRPKASSPGRVSGWLNRRQQRARMLQIPHDPLPILRSSREP